MTGTIFPVQQIGHQLQYNRYASIYWGLPSSEVVSAMKANVAGNNGKGVIDHAPATILTSRTAPAATRHAKQYDNTALDYIYSVDELMYNGYCGIKIGDEYFVSSWQGYKFISIFEMMFVAECIYGIETVIDSIKPAWICG